jgi:hypothetical protein
MSRHSRARVLRDPNKIDWRYFCLLTIIGALTWAAVLVFTSPKAEAAPLVTERWQQPYGGCDEAWQAPSSAGADECRAHGWTIRARLVVGPRGVVRMSALPHCRNEDGSGQRSACSWNFHDGQRDGDGRGASLWLDRHDRSHYVWATNPLRARPAWHWANRVDQRLLHVPRQCITLEWSTVASVAGGAGVTARCPG